ncbi:MAG TPA: nucleotidyltransferase family protein [Polyangia bacterium]
MNPEQKSARARVRFEKCVVHVSKTLLDAMGALEAGVVRIALVIDDRERLVGVLTDGNIRRAILAGASTSAPLEPHVQRQFISVPPTAGRAEVLDLMQALTIEQVPVLDDERRLVGLHLFRDLLGVGARPNWAVVLAGGEGLRLRPLTETVPKPMLKVAGRPILERLVLHLIGHGIRRMFLSVNYLAQQIREHFGSGEKFGCRIEYLEETEPLGTGGCLALLPERSTTPLLVLNGDLVTQFDVGTLLDGHASDSRALTVGVRTHQYTVPLGVIQTEEGRVQGIQEKPTFSWQTNAGIYVVSPELCDRVPKGRPFQMPDLIADCLDRGEAVGAHPIEDDWIDVGRASELKRARAGE